MNKLFVVVYTFFIIAGFISQEKVELVIQSGHYDEIKVLAFTANGKYLTSGAKDGKIIIWDLKTGKIENLDMDYQL